MKTNKFLRILSIILETAFIGSIILYMYNYFIAHKKYEIIPAMIKTRLNIFIFVAIIAFILFLIVKYVLYVRNISKAETEQLQMNIDEEHEEICYRNLEAPVTERVFLYKNEYDVPKDRRMHCPNCNSIIDKNAFICIKCGYLIKKIVQEKVVERVIEKPITKVVEKTVEKPVYNKSENIYESKSEKIIVKRFKDKEKLINILINLGLIIAIIIVLIMIINQGIQRGIIR